MTHFKDEIRRYRYILADRINTFFHMRRIKRCGKCGSNLRWTLYDNGKLVVSGIGSMDDYSEREAPWYADRKSINELCIQKGVTSIGNYAFQCCEGLSSIVLPQSVTHIGQCAFEYCKKLSFIRFPEGLTHIGHCAFHYTGLTSIVIPKSITRIDGRAFAGCCKITSITLPENVINLGSCPYTGGPDLFCKVPALTANHQDAEK